MLLAMMSTPTPEPKQSALPSAPLDPRRHRDLFGARSVLGALGVIAVLCVFGFGIQAVDDAVKRSSGFDVGKAYVVSQTTSFTPRPGWEIIPDSTIPDSLVTSVKNGVTMKVEGAFQVPEGMTFEKFVKTILYDTDKGNEDYSQVSPQRTFATANGVHGVTWDAHGPQNATATWALVNGKSIAVVTARGSGSSWASVEPDLEAVAKSIVLVPAKETSP